MFFKSQDNRYVKTAFYGLRSVIVGLIGYTALKFAISNGIIGGSSFFDIKSVIILLVGFSVLLKNKLHPVLLILASAMAGVLMF